MSKAATALRPDAGEPILTLGASAAVKSGVNRDIAGTVAQNDARRQQISESQRQTLERRNAERQAGEEAPPPLPDQPREDVESVEVPLPNGRVIEFGPPKDVAMVFKMAAILGDQISNQVMNGTVTLLLCVREVDGKKQPMIQNMVDAQKLANVIGDTGLDYLMQVYIRYWPAVSVADLNTLKKTLRTPTS